MERLDDLLGDPSRLGEVLRVVGGAQLLGALPGDERLVVGRVGLDRCGEPRALLVGEVLGPSAKDGLDPVERVAPASPMPEGVLLDAAADLVNSSGVELDDVERVEHRGGVFEFVVDRGLVSVERVQRRDLHVLAERVAALTEPGRVGLP